MNLVSFSLCLLEFLGYFIAVAIAVAVCIFIVFVLLLVLAMTFEKCVGLFKDQW